MSLLDSIQKVYWICATEPPQSIEEDKTRYNLSDVFDAENKKLCAAYNWIFAKARTKLPAATDDELERYGIFIEDGNQYKKYFRFPEPGSGFDTGKVDDDGNAIIKQHPMNGAFMRMIAIYLPSLRSVRGGGNLMDMDKDVRDPIEWERFSNGIFINRDQDDYIIIDYIPDAPQFDNDPLGRVYSENYLSAVEYMTAAVALDRVFPDNVRKQSAMQMSEKYLRMAVSSDTRIVKPKVKVSSYELPHTRKWLSRTW